MADEKNINTESVEENSKAEETKSAEKTVEESNDEIKETTGSDIEIYEDYEEAEVVENTKKKFRLKKRYVVGAAAVLLVAGLGTRAYLAGKNQVTYVETMPVSLGNIENVLSVSGTVESADTKTYFSDVTAPIEKINVKVGDKVSSGDVIYTYDQEALELSEKTAELAITQAKGSYSTTAAGTIDAQYAQGMTLQQVNDRLDAITAEVDALNNKITEKTNRMNQTLTDLQKTAYDINQNGISDSSEGYFESGSTSYIYRNETDTKKDGEYTEPSESDRQMSLAVQQSILDVQYALSNDPEIQGWKNQITALQEEQAHLQSAKSAKISGGSVSAAKASMESTELTQEDTIEKIQEAKDGIKSDFNGVVTAINVVEGATVAAGAQTVTVANLDDVQVTVQISKSDLPKIAIGQDVDITINDKPYTGKVTKISGSATKNTNGVAVVDTIIEVTNPDTDIILGVEASNKIHAEKAENTVVLPYEYVQTDSQGDYVYVLEDGVVTRRDVTIGISSSTEAQITEGLSEGEEVIISDSELFVEGMPAVAMP